MSDDRKPRGPGMAMLLLGIGLVGADPPEPKPPDSKVSQAKSLKPLPADALPREMDPDINSIKPRPLVPIPDDPPPHEGAMIDLPYTVEPPDLLLVEVLEALPGRPISGERLVRPGGSVSLGFYGDVYVRGLTTDQIKEKIIRHLRAFLPDETLGLSDLSVPEAMDEEPRIPENSGEAKGGPPKTSKRPVETRQVPQLRSTRGRPRSRRVERAVHTPPEKSDPGVFTLSPSEVLERPATTSTDLQIPAGGNLRITIEVGGTASGAVAPPLAEPEVTNSPEIKITPIRPIDSERVFVDVTAYNSKNYYVQGDVAAPGKLPWTGNETVLDAMNHAGGLVHTADPKNIRLVRPARGGKPAQIYPVDLEAITERGEKEKNYQVFPNDRIIVGRYAMVKTTTELDRLAAPIQTVLSAISQNANMMRNLTLAAETPTVKLTPEQREAMVKAWVDFWWRAASRPEGVALDEKTFREALTKALRVPEIDKARPAPETK